MRTIILVIAALCLFLSHADITAGEGKVVMHFFRGQGCPHCAEEEVFLAGLKKEHPGLEVRDYEVWHDKDNARLFGRVMAAAGVKTGGVPVTVVADAVFVGFDEETGKKIAAKVRECLKQACEDPVGEYIAYVKEELKAPEKKPEPVKEKTTKKEVLEKKPEPSVPKPAADKAVTDDAGDKGITAPIEIEKKTRVSVPLIGELDAERFSLPVLTLVLGGLDSLNPCAFFVLFSLLGLLVHAKSRARMFLIGGTFVFFSGLMYFLFMAAWLNLFLIAGRVALVTGIAGGVALIIATINVKDFFFFKKGVSLSIPEGAKPGLFERMRGLLKAASIPSMLMGAVVLAVLANAYELLCTAGFPMVYTRVLTLHGLGTAGYYTYLFFYNVVYVIPLAAIVVVFSATLGSKKLSEWQGRKLKLVSGLMMLGLGLVLVLKPELMNNVLTAVGLLVAALIASWVIIAFNKNVGPEPSRS